MLELSKKYLNIDKNDLKKKDLKVLQTLISYHSDLYYNKDEPIISDSEYDDLFKKLEHLEEKYQIDFKQTLLVWAEIIESTFEKVKHSRPMISLDNTYNETDLRDFDERVKKNIEQSKGEVSDINYCLEFKFDGLWIELIYKSWELVQAITRWNWVEWEDVTQNIFQIDNIPKKIPYTDHLEVRGEIVMPISSFDKLNEKAKNTWTKVFSNPRNAASWSVRTKDISVTKQRNLKFFAYDLANFDDYLNSPKLEGNIDEYYDVIMSLENLWFEISSYFKKLNSIEEIILAIENFGNVKKEIDFEIDWLVLKVNNISLWKEIGWTEHHPRYAIAYKFPAEIVTTKIISVDHQVWKTWALTPVANLEPINIWWVIVKRATLHNYEEVEKLDVRIWDTIFIKRAWEVIPKIISVVKDSPQFPVISGEEATFKIRDNFEKIVVPEFCPSCMTKLKKDEDKVRYYCPNSFDCPAQHIEKLVFAVWKWWFNIDWFWEKQVELFLSVWIIHNLVDIFKISEKREDILSLEWFKEKSVNNLILWVENAKNMEITTFLTALSIPWVGKKTAKTLSKLFKSKNDLLFFSYDLEDLTSLDDIWPEIGQNVINYFTSENHLRIISELIEVINLKYYIPTTILGWDENNKFYQKKVCITWSFINYSRDELIKKLEEVWGEFVSSVSKNTNFLLAWEKAWSKLEKAEKLWVKVIDVWFFLENLNNKNL